MPTDEAPPMITAPVSPHDLNRALKRDSNTCNNDICYSPATCFGPVGNIAVCCQPGEDCSMITTCYPYTEIQSYSSLGLSSNMSIDAGGSYCSIPEYPYCNTYVFDAYSGLEVIYCDDTSTANNQVILTGTYNWTDGLTVASQIPAPLTATEYKTVVSLFNIPPSKTSTASSTSTSIGSSLSTFAPTSTATPAITHQALPTSAVIGTAVGATLLGAAIIVIAILLWRRHSSTTNMPRVPSNTEIKIASYASPVSPLTSPHTSWAPTAIASEKSPSYGYEARRIGIQPDCQAEGVGEGIHALPAWAPRGGVMGKRAEPAFVSELGGESRDEGGMGESKQGNRVIKMG
ncbi:hypothetical protein EYC80_008622 [Monilinia laxa]|uniref:Uncharacterized protein n=1 Tax=Monilinia laxa TaxID=61186 RepID=A0A5N6K1B1_MONLA|nr:hypothetical protein EYC80_008622 [Monilinia laxa]